MCGIAAHFSMPGADPETVRRMLGTLRHRGPDDEGSYAEGPIALGHRRLSIIDVAGGAQPIFNEDRTVAVVFNGEIYNYRELAAELSHKHLFRTQSDTEVLVHLYEEHGTDMLARLRGMFAFVLWDARKHAVFAARDRFGEKPLVYLEGRGGLWLASEVRALAQAGLPLGSVSPQAVAEYLSLLYIPAPASIWSNVRKLEAGHMLLADKHGVRVRRYWSPPRPGAWATEPAGIVARTRELLEESARLRLRSDVPIAVLLSGGVDSSTVAALAARASGARLKTFSVGFGRPDDELPQAREVALRYGTDHEEIVIRENLHEVVPRALAAFSEPFGDSSAVPCVEVFLEVARHVKVVLTGDGGDELFAGYDRYRQVAALPHLPLGGALARTLDRLPETRGLQRVRRGVRVLTGRRGARYRALIEVFSARERERLLGIVPAALGVPDDESTDADAALAFDLGVYLPDDLLVKTDITSMAASVEARCPLLDHQLAEWVIPAPIGAKQSRRRGKLLLEAATRDLLPPHVYSRPKRGFGSPVEQWLRGPLRALFEDTVMSPQARIRDWLDSRSIREVGRAVLEGRSSGHQGWALLALEAWGRAHERDAAGPMPRTGPGESSDRSLERC
jgi:asparagine synthase (glutamine-hydrolysing)